MAQVSRYEDAATAFLQDHPIGSIVTADRLVGWAAKYKNGLSPDLLLTDPGKRLTALRRHLNDGGASRNLPEASRFCLAIDDAKRKTHSVILLSDYVSQQAEVAFSKSVRGAISPLNSAQKAIDDVKLDELPDERRDELQTQLQELIETVEPVKKMFSTQVHKRWIASLMTKGYTEQQARNMIEVMPSLARLEKLRKITD